MDKKKSIKSVDLLMSSLSKFYSVKSNINKIKPYINGEGEVSLRLIDWFICNYSKKFNTIITKLVNNNVLHFSVHLSYRSQLKSYGKTYFDSFRRRDRIKFYYDGKNFVETTVGQLNAFRWLIQNDILDYIIQHKSSIEEDMINTQKENQKKKLDRENIKVKMVQTDNGVVITTRKKRNELSKSILKNMNQVPGQRLISFD